MNSNDSGYDALRPFVLLTATVIPNTTRNVSLCDPDVRLKQYQRALRAWFLASRQGQEFSLAVVETSGVPKEAFVSSDPILSSSRILFTNFTPPALDNKGKGFSEWLAVESAIKALNLPDEVTLYKVTGRLMIRNSEQVIVPLEQDSIAIRMRIDGSLADTRIVGATIGNWRNVLIPAKGDIDLSRGIDLEHSVAARVTFATHTGQAKRCSFVRRPLFEGISAFNNHAYNPWRTLIKSQLVRPLEQPLAFLSNRIAH